MERLSPSREARRRGLGQVAVAGTLWGTIGPATQVIYGLTPAKGIAIK